MFLPSVASLQDWSAESVTLGYGTQSDPALSLLEPWYPFEVDPTTSFTLRNIGYRHVMSIVVAFTKYCGCSSLECPRIQIQGLYIDTFLCPYIHVASLLHTIFNFLVNSNNQYHVEAECGDQGLLLSSRIV